MRWWVTAVLSVFAAFLICGCQPQKPLAATGGAQSSADPFVDVTAQARISFRLEPAKRPMRILESLGSGCAFLDFDGDGALDVLLVGSPRCALYRNRGDGSFVDVTVSSGLGREGTWTGCATGDYDNDGDPDLFLTGYRVCALLRNGGDGTFADVTRAAGIRTTAWSTAAAFSDLDRDGRLDLYVGAYCVFGPSAPQYCELRAPGVKSACRPLDYDPLIGQCYRGRENGTFEDVTRRWGLDAAHGRNLGVTVADYNQDGWPDLYLANDEIEADLFENRGRGQGFANVAVTTGTAYGCNAQIMGGMGVDWGDYDGDGWLDLLVGTFEGEPKPLFRNQEGRGFECGTGSSQLQSTAYPYVVWGSLLFDFDHDSRLDIAFLNGHFWDNAAQLISTSTFRQPAVLLRNTPAGQFLQVESPAFAVATSGRGLACGDMDNDGDLDLLAIDADGPVRLLRNECNGRGNWLQVRTIGSRSNRDGLGARVTITHAGKRQVSEVRTARSYLSACDPRLHFGLGSALTVERVEIRWPSGKVSELRDVDVNRVLVVREGE